MNRVPVWVGDASFDAAIAQLPERVVRSAQPRGAICVVDGRRERHENVRTLLAEDAAAVVLAHPGRARPELIGALDEAVVPVVVDRPLLRADDAEVVSREALRPRHILVEAIGARPHFRAVLLDAVGWVRILDAGEIDVVSRARTDDAVLAALRSSSGVEATVSGARLSTAVEPALAVDGLGERRLEVELDVAAGIRAVRVHGENGALVHASADEAHERLALRRALAALDGTEVADLDELRRDSRIVDAILGSALA